MPRAVKDPEEDAEAKNGRRTRASVLANVTDSPLRRSTRIRHNPEGSSPESVTNVETAPVTRTTRRRAAAMETAPTDPPRMLRSRGNSFSSNMSELTDLESVAGTPKRRSTRTSIAVVPSAETPKANSRNTKRTGRAASETKSPPAATRSTRRTRGNSVDPEPSNELITKRGVSARSTSQPGTPTRGRRRASALPNEPSLPEETKEMQSAILEVSDIAEAEMEVDSTPARKSFADSPDIFAPESVKKSSKNKSFEEDADSPDEEMEIDESPAKVPFMESPGRSSPIIGKVMSRNKSLKKETKSTSLEGNVSPQITRSKELEDSIASGDQMENAETAMHNLSSKSTKRSSLEAKELGFKIEDLLNKSTEEQEKSPGNKENEKLNVLPGIAKRNLQFTVANVALLGRRSLGSALSQGKTAKQKLNTSLDEQVLSRAGQMKDSGTSLLPRISRKSLEAEDIEVLNQSKRLSFKKYDSKEDSIIFIEEKLSDNSEESMEVDGKASQDSNTKKKYNDKIPEDQAKNNFEIPTTVCYVRLDKTAVDEAQALDRSGSSTTPENKHSVSRSEETLETEQEEVQKQLDAEEENTSGKNISLVEIVDTPEKQLTPFKTSDCYESHDDSGNNENEKEEVDAEKPKAASRRIISEDVMEKSNDVPTKRPSLNVSRTEKQTVVQQKHQNESVTDDLDDGHKQKRKSLGKSSTEEDHIDSESTSFSNMGYQSINESEKQTENSPSKRYSSTLQKSSEASVKSLNKEQIQSKRRNSVRNQSSNANVDSESDVSIGHLFCDISADEWEKKNKGNLNQNLTNSRRKENDEMSSLHSLSTEKLEHDSEVDYDLILVDKEAWKAAEEERNASKIEYNDEYDSDDTIILKSRQDSSQIEVEKVGDRRKSANSSTVGVKEFGNDKELSENNEVGRKSLGNRKSLNKSRDSGEGAALALRKSGTTTVEDTGLDNENVEEMVKDNLVETESKNKKRKSLNKSLTETNKSFQFVDNWLTTESADKEMEQGFQEETTSGNKERKSLNKSTTKTNRSIQVVSMEESSEDSSEDKSDSGTDDSETMEVNDSKKKLSQKQNLSITLNESNEVHKSKTPMNRNYSIIAVTGSNSDTESSDDSYQNIPSFLYNVTSSESEDDNSSSKMDTDIAREMNLDGNTSLVYSDDDVPADECRASESEYSDEDDDGSDLADFVVLDNEVSEESEHSDEDEDEDSEVDGTDKKKYRRIRSNSTSDEGELEIEDKEEKNSDEEVENYSVDTKSKQDDDFNDSNVTKSSRRVKKLNSSQDSDIPEFSQSPRNESLNKSNKKTKNATPLKSETETSALLISKNGAKNDSPSLETSVDTKSGKKSKKPGRAEDLVSLNESGTEKSVKKKLNDELNVSDTKTPSKKARDTKELNVSKEKTPKSAKKCVAKSESIIEEINILKLKTPKISELNKSMQTPNTETPVTKFLKKERLNESMPLIELKKKAKKMKESVMDNVDEDESGDDIEMHHENEKSPENERDSDEGDESEDVEGEDDEPNGDGNEEEDEEDKEEESEEDGERESEEDEEHEDEEDEDEDDEEDEESSEDIINVSAKQTKKHKHKTNELKVLTNGKRSRNETSEDSEPETDEGTNSKIIKKSKTKPEQNGATSSSDEAPESIGFTEARTKALEAMKNAAASVKASKDAKKKKRTEQLERIRQEKEAKIQRSVQEGNTVKTTLKRLPEDVLENLSDVPVRPQKRRKLSKKEEKIMPSKSMFIPGMPVEANIEVQEGWIPLSSSGGTTQFGIINIEKIKKKQPKKATAVASFREQMLSRNPRQPVSAFLVYQEKQKASGKNKFSRRPT